MVSIVPWLTLSASWSTCSMRRAMPYPCSGPSCSKSRAPSDPACLAESVSAAPSCGFRYFMNLVRSELHRFTRTSCASHVSVSAAPVGRQKNEITEAARHPMAPYRPVNSIPYACRSHMRVLRTHDVSASEDSRQPPPGGGPENL